MKTDPVTLERGKTLIEVAIGLVLLPELFVAFMLVTTGAPIGAGRFVRFALTGAVCYYLYQGSYLAKWLLVVVLTLGLGTVVTLTVTGGVTPEIVPVWGMGICYAIAPGILVFSKSANAFLAARSSAREASNGPAAGPGE